MPTTTRGTARDATVKQPQDHLPKGSENGAHSAAEDRFTFTHDGETYAFAKDFDEVVTPGWVMDNYDRGEMWMAMSILKLAAGPEALGVLHAMDWPEFMAVLEKVGERVGDVFPQT